MALIEQLTGNYGMSQEAAEVAGTVAAAGGPIGIPEEPIEVPPIDPPELCIPEIPNPCDPHAFMIGSSGETLTVSGAGAAGTAATVGFAGQLSSALAIMAI